MSIKVTSIVWEHSQARESALLVMLAIADFADDGGRAFPSIPSIAKKARLSERGVRYVIRSLQDAGELAVEEHRGRNHSNVYQINLHQLLQVIPAETGSQMQVIETENRKLSAGLEASENLQSATLKPAISDIKPAIAVAPQPSVEPSENRQLAAVPKPPLKKQARAKREYPQNPEFEALVEECTGEAWADVKPWLTDTEAGEYGAALAELKGRPGGVTVQQIHDLAAAYRRKMPGMEVTPSALKKHAARVMSRGSPISRVPKPTYLQRDVTDAAS